LSAVIRGSVVKVSPPSVQLSPPESRWAAAELAGGRLVLVGPATDDEVVRATDDAVGPVEDAAESVTGAELTGGDDGVDDGADAVDVSGGAAEPVVDGSGGADEVGCPLDTLVAPADRASSPPEQETRNAVSAAKPSAERRTRSRSRGGRVGAGRRVVTGPPVGIGGR
jgi:hypothetical protein